MKKKALAISLAVALIAIMVSGTLAYFTAEDKVENIFTIGSVEIEIHENGAVTTETVRPMGQLAPVVNANSNDPGYKAKAVKVENTGLNAAYIRLHIAQPVELLGYLELEMDKNGWTRLPTTYATLGTQRYVVATFDYNTAVEPDAFTTELLKAAYLVPEVDIKDNPDTLSADLEFCKPDGNGGYTFSGFVAHGKTDTGYTGRTVSILIAAEAIQAQGFDDATTALNSGFGERTNPWME